MNSEHLNNFANELKKVREQRKLTIDQIFIKTRIDKKYLNAIENGNFSIMPEVYIRAFIKEYAKAVGLDADEIMLQYDVAREGKPYQDSLKEEIENKDSSSEKTITRDVHSSSYNTAPTGPESPKYSNKTIYYVIGAVSMLLTIFIVYKVFLTDSEQIIITEKPFEEIIEEQENKKSSTADYEVSESQSVIDADKIQPKGLTKIVDNKSISSDGNPVVQQPLREGEMILTVVAEDESWMRVVSDQKDNVEFIIQKGMTKVFNAKDKFYLHIGNSGGLKLYLNNKDLSFRGSPGKVRKIFITEDGIEYLRRTPVLNAEQE